MNPRRPAITTREHSRTPKSANLGGSRKEKAAGNHDRNQRRSAQQHRESVQPPESPAARSGVFDYGMQSQRIGCSTFTANYGENVKESVWIPGVHVDTATIITGAHNMMQRALSAALFLAEYRKISVPLSSALCMADLVAFLKSIGEMK